MGREVRRVPADWQHPKRPDGRHEPLFEGDMFDGSKEEHDEELRKWNARKCDVEDPSYYDDHTFEDWHGGPPCIDDYMPDWPDDQKTHLMMYETCSEGTPISPAFATPELLARWLADNNASAMASEGATYEQWLRVARGGFAPSMVATMTPQGPTNLRSGVAWKDE